MCLNASVRIDFPLMTANKRIAGYEIEQPNKPTKDIVSTFAVHIQWMASKQNKWDTWETIIDRFVWFSLNDWRKN